MYRTLIFFLAALFIIGCEDMREKKKYSDMEKSLLSNTHYNIWKLKPLFSYEEALIEAKKRNENVLVLFTGINDSGNPSQIFNLLNSDRITTKIERNYIFCLLFLDVPYKLKEEDLKTMKEINSSLQNTLIGRSDTHNFVKINSDGDMLSKSFNCSSCSEDELLEFL